MHYLYYEALESARNTQMTDEEREEQLVSRVYGNIHFDQPAVTRELVRDLVRKHARERNADAAAGDPR